MAAPSGEEYTPPPPRFMEVKRTENRPILGFEFHHSLLGFDFSWVLAPDRHGSFTDQSLTQIIMFTEQPLWAGTCA